MWSCGHLSWFLCVVGLSAVRCNTIYLEHNAPTDDEIWFMKRYGYLPETQGDTEFSYTPESLSEALRTVQAYAGLPQTGVVDPETKKLFRRKRCGVKDIIENSKHGRARRYAVVGGWSKRNVTYRVLKGSRSLSKERVEALAGQAFDVWAPHGGLTFTRIHSGEADIMISFVTTDHGDGAPFDGQGGVVAHAFQPPVGTVHFDDDEFWGDGDSFEDDAVTDFFAVALHEFGHALGMLHSATSASVMYSYYKAGVDKLYMDDILGMHDIYMKETETNEIAEATSPGAPAVPRFTKAESDDEELDENYYPDLCMANYDTLQVIHDKIFVFEEEWVWVLRDFKQLEEGYPRRFHDVFRGLPANVNVIKTIYQKANRNVVIFKGRKFWEFDPAFRLMKRGTLAKYSIPAYVPELSTVFISNYTNKTYLIDEERFWRYDERKKKMDKGYPKDMSAWRNVPSPVDAAVVWKGDTYLFHGPRFWRFDNERIKAHEHYPLPVAQIWFNCTPTAEMRQYFTNERP